MTKATRSLIASEKGIERAGKALIDLGINQTVFGERLGFSRSTISSFFNRTKPIDHTYFTKICKTLNLNWEEIVEKNNPMKLDNSQIQNTTGVEINSSRLKKAFVIEGSFPIDALTQAKIQALVKQLQKITGDASLEIVDIQEGSIKIILKGTPEALSMIQDLYDSGQLNELVQRADLSGANPSIKQSALENVSAGGNISVSLDQAISALSTMKKPTSEVVKVLETEIKAIQNQLQLSDSTAKSFQLEKLLDQKFKQLKELKRG